jgi:tetratricopeptide (TPR) repeat protein
MLWMSLGTLGFAQGDTSTFPDFKPETAREYIRAVAGTVQDQAGVDVDACFILARVRSQLGEKDAAEKLARQALDRDPSRVEIHSFLAGMLIQQDRMEEAARCLHQAVRLKPEAARDHRQLGMVLDRLGDRTGAQNEFETVIRLSPTDATGRLLLGRLLLDQGAKEAAFHLEKACQLDPTLAGAHYALSQVRRRLGDQDGARESLKTYQELREKEKEALDAQNAALDNEKGMRILAAGVHTELASYFLRRQQAAVAERHLLQAVRIAPGESRGYEMLSGILLQSGRLAEARGLCEELVRKWPNRAAYRVNLGTLLMQLKEPTAAVEELKRALVLDPKQPMALANLARFYLNTRQNLPDALTLCRSLVELDPAAAHYDLLGWALYANGQIEAARQASAQAVERDPGNAVYRERHQKLLNVP